METIVSPALSRDLSREDLIKQYFFEGYEYCVIINFVFCTSYMGYVCLSVRQLKMVLRCMNLRRCVHPSSHYHRTIRSLILVSNPWPFVYLILLLYWVPCAEKDHSILPSFYSSILPFFLTSILHPSILIVCHVLVASAHVKAIVGQQKPLAVGQQEPLPVGQQEPLAVGQQEPII